MADIFRIETDKTALSWSGKIYPDRASDVMSFPGRLLITPHRHDTAPNIKTWRTGLPPELSSAAGVQIGPRLYEETSYTLFLNTKEANKIELRHRDPTILQGLSHSYDNRVVHGTLNFKSQVGRSQFTVLVDDKPEYDFEVEVFPTKLDYNADYEALLADVQDILAALVLEYLQSTFKLGFTTDSIRSTKLEWITLLRHLIDELERALHYISQRPQHGLTRKRLPTRIDKLRRPDATIFKMVIQGKGMGPKSRIAPGVVLHTKLPEHRAQVTLDTPEHRWLASQLKRIRQQLAHIHTEERRRISKDQESSPRQSRILQEITAFENRIAVLQRLEPIAEAKGLAPAGFTSLKLQASPGYREAYRSCLILSLGLRVAGGPVGLSVKQIHQLYEYWCYLALLKLLAEITGERLPVSKLLSIEQEGLRVQLQKGKSQKVIFPIKPNRSVELTYNPRYSGDAFIFAQQPDIILTLRDPAWPTVRLVLDAKYRIRADVDYVKQLGSPGPPDNAINVLHRYRDAILEQVNASDTQSDTLKKTVIEGVALFPYRDVEDQFRNSRLWTALDRVGIGALPFLPSETRYVREWMQTVLQRGGWSTAERFIPYVSQTRLAVSQTAATEAVLIGVLRPNAKDHLEWVKRECCYYTPLNSRQPRQLIVRWIGIYSPASLRPPGAITHVAVVRNIAVKERRKITTPWSSDREPERLYVVYDLEELIELKKPIENRGQRGSSERFSVNRWTSRLGLLRASNLRELFLETEPEWRLYEELKIAGADFTLVPGSPKLQEKDDPRGRTWFVASNVQVQYRGSAGFLIKTASSPNVYQADRRKVVERFLSINQLLQ